MLYATITISGGLSFDVDHGVKTVPFVVPVVEDCPGDSETVPCEFSPSDIDVVFFPNSSDFSATVIGDGTRLDHISVDLIAEGLAPQLRNGKAFDIFGNAEAECAPCDYDIRSVRPGFNSTTGLIWDFAGQARMSASLDYSYMVEDIPEPSSWASVLGGLTVLLGLAMRRRRGPPFTRP